MIKDLGIGPGTFLKVEYSLELRDNHMINIGETFLIINLIYETKCFDNLDNTEGLISDQRQLREDGHPDFPTLRVKAFGGPASGQVCYFYPTMKDFITVGRKDSDFTIDDEVLSKNHCTFYFDRAQCVGFLEDGFQ